MKILVGILYSIEKEFNECIRAIEKQSYNDFEYFIIKNLPKKEAHDLLYSTFMDKAKEFELFIKIDADMVLIKDTFFKDVVNRFSEEPDIDDLCISVFDFFTQRLIWGLHIYSNRVKWKIDSNEKLFTDRIDDAQKVVFDNESELAPAAVHCPNPSLFQSFHYGLHKAVKVTQIGKEEKNFEAAKSHLYNIGRIIKFFGENGDRRIGIAALGALKSINKNFSYKEVDFDSQKSQNLYSTIKNLSLKEIANEIEREKIFALFFLPESIKLDILLLKKNPKFYRPESFLPLIKKISSLFYWKFRKIISFRI